MSIQAEIAILGSLLKVNDSFDRLPTDFHESDFIREDHRIIFSSIKSIIDSGKPADLITIAESLNAQNYLNRAGGLPYLSELVQGANSSANIAAHAKTVKNASILRKLKAASNEIQSLCDSHQDPKEIAVEAERKILGVLDTQTERDYVHISLAVSEAVDYQDEERKGVKSGLLDLDRLVGQFGNSNLIILAARPAMGKSSLAMQIAEHAGKSNTSAVFSLEMTRVELGNRMLKYHTVKTGSRNDAHAHLSGLNIQIDDTPAITLGHIRSRCRRIKRQHGLGLIVVDYLQLMCGEGNSRTEEIGSISRGLKAIAKEFDVPVIALSQLNRRLEERTDKRPVMSDLRDSGEIEQDADLILFIYRDEIYDSTSRAKGTAELICRKNRHGAIGDVRAEFVGETTRFLNYDGSPIDIDFDIPKKRNFSI